MKNSEGKKSSAGKASAKTAWGKKVEKRMGFVEKTATRLHGRAASAKRAS